MQSINHVIDEVAIYISELKKDPGKFYFSKIDRDYAYSQIPFDDSIQKHRNSSILGGKTTETYRFVNGFYGLTLCRQISKKKPIDKTGKCNH